MRTVWIRFVGLAVVCALAGCSSPVASSSDNSVALDAAARAMGATNLKSIQYSGSGTTYGFSQSRTPDTPWPAFNAKVVVAIDYETPSMRNEIIRSQRENPPRGGAGQPMVGEIGYAQYVSGTQAWSETINNPNPEGPGGAQPGAVKGRLIELWKSPHGIIKAAIANNARIDGKVISFELEGQKIRATLNDQNLVERVEAVVDNPVLGDMLVEHSYKDYADYGGVKFPTRIIERQDEGTTLDITVDDVKPNARVTLTVPSSVRQAPPPGPLKASAKQIADGVWLVTVGGVSSVAIVFTDHIVVFEAPGNEARTLAINESIRNGIPGKPIKYVVNSHYHFEHSGGLRTYVAEGAAVITHATNKAFFEKAWARPRTVNPDRLAKSPKPVKIQTVDEKLVLSDSSRTLELHHVQGNSHNEGMLIAYLPKERILVQADMYYPPTVGDEPRDLSRTVLNTRNLYENIQRLKLSPTQLVSVHGGLFPMDNMRKAIGLMPRTSE